MTVRREWGSGKPFPKGELTPFTLVLHEFEKPRDFFYDLKVMW